jgi:hypothetical protein
MKICHGALLAMLLAMMLKMLAMMHCHSYGTLLQDLMS